MDKTTFISEVSKPLKEAGYKKTRNYWHKICNDLIFCINVQGSQWDRNDYYVEIGISLLDNISNPSLLRWHCRHRCHGMNGGKNPQPDELFSCITEIFERIQTVDDVEDLLREKEATKIGSQYWF